MTSFCFLQVKSSRRDLWGLLPQFHWNINSQSRVPVTVTLVGDWTLLTPYGELPPSIFSVRSEIGGFITFYEVSVRNTIIDCLDSQKFPVLEKSTSSLLPKVFSSPDVSVMTVGTSSLVFRSTLHVSTHTIVVVLGGIRCNLCPSTS